MRTLRTLTLTAGLLLPTIPHTALAITIPASQDASITNVAIGPSCGVSGDSTSARVGLLTESSGKGTSSSKWRTLLHFDLSQIPHNATITQADLVLHIQSITGSPVVEIRRLTNSVWDETNVLWDVYACDADGSGPQQAGLWCTAGGDFTTVQAPPNWTPPGTGEQQVSILALVQKAVGQASSPADPDTGGHLHLLLKTVGDSGGTFTFATTNQASVPPPRIDVTWSGGDPPAGGPWVTFRDETDARLQAPPTGPEGFNCTSSGTGGWTACDRLEKDIAVADFDKDGDVDVIIARKQPFGTAGPEFDVLLLNEHGTLVDRTEHPGNPSSATNKFVPVKSDARDVLTVDLDADAWPDLVLATTCDDTPKFYENLGAASTRCNSWPGLRNRTVDQTVSGQLIKGWAPASYHSNLMRFCAVAAGTIDTSSAPGSDPYPDLYFANYRKACDLLPGPEPTPGPVDEFVLINDISGSSGRFLDQSASRLGTNMTHGTFGTSAEIHDFDADGRSDDLLRLLVGEVQVIVNAGNPGNLTSFPTLVHDLAGYMTSAGDLNNDGILDIYVVTDQEDRVYLATASSSPPAYPPVNQGSEIGGPGTRTTTENGNVKLGDLDGDGDLDAGVADVDVDFADSCNFCRPDDVCSASPIGCQFPDHFSCAEDNVTGPRRTFALLRNTNAEAQIGTGDLRNVWEDLDNQPFHLKTYDFAFLDINGDGCLDLFMGLCSGYRVFIQNCPSTGSF